MNQVVNAPKHSPKQGSQGANEEIPTVHWADHAAQELVEKHPDKAVLVCASGISPSGVVHIGNFREVITVAFVVQALKDRNRKVRFIYSWDDYDALRKVPANLPNKEMLEKELRKPLALIPDPFGQEKSYALFFERQFEKSLSQMEIAPEYIRQNERYRAADYTDGIKHALQNLPAIKEILNKSKTDALAENWTCASVFCSVCGRDTTEVLAYIAPTTLKYRCKACKKELETDFAKAESGVKLLWRVDWPMRWAKETVDFEPGGKDHSSQGGSYETGAEISRTIWKREPPQYLQYDFVLAKGMGSKLSSSSGNLITLDEALEIYEPAIVRWIFASRKPNIDFSIAFDLDVMRAYDDFDRTSRIALKLEAAEDKKYFYEKRIYELSRTSDYPTTEGFSGTLAQFPFRHLCNVLQINQGDIEKSKSYYADTLKSAQDAKRFEMRASRAWNWINKFAPPEFRFSLRTDSDAPVKTKYPELVQEVVHLLNNAPREALSEEWLSGEMHTLVKKHSLDSKAFFQEMYHLLIAKPAGPKLASFLLTLGPKTAASLLQKAL